MPVAGHDDRICSDLIRYVMNHLRRGAITHDRVNGQAQLAELSLLSR